MLYVTQNMTFLKPQLTLHSLLFSVSLPTQRLLTGWQKCALSLRIIVQGKVFCMAEGVISKQHSLNA